VLRICSSNGVNWGGGGTPLNLTSKIFVCLIVRCILWSGNYRLPIKAPRFSWPLSQVYSWISPFRCIMWSYSISVYTAVAVHFTLAAFDHIPPQINIFSDLQETMSQLRHTTHLNVQKWVQSQINVYTTQSDIMMSVQVSPAKISRFSCQMPLRCPQPQSANTM